MDKMNRLPSAYIKAKIAITDKKIESIPVIKLGTHNGRCVLRSNHFINGKRVIEETYADTDKGRDWLSKYETRKQLIKFKKQLEAILIDKPDMPPIDPSRVNTVYNKEYWDNIIVRAQMETKTDGYEYRGMKMDSRAEMIVAQTLDEMGLQYKYEPMLIIGDEVYYPDFIVYLPEFGRCFFIEFMGRLDSDKYISRNEFKLMDYLNDGMVLNRDLLIFCGYESSMITADEMAADIAALIEKYCRIYSI